MENKKEYTISEVAKMFSIKRDTLLFYDKIGLFAPDSRRENNYRLYTANQLALLDTIVNLRDLGLPIKSISEFTKERSVESFTALANEALDATDEEIKKLIERQKVLNETKREIIEASNAEYGKIEIKELEEVEISLSDIGDYSSSIPTFDKNYEDFMTEFQVPWIVIAGLKIDLDKLLTLDDYTKECRLFSKRGKIKNSKIDKGLYANLYFKGSWADSKKWCLYILDEVKRLGYIPTGPYYEENPIAHLVEEDERSFVTKIIIKIEPSKKES